MKWIHILLIIGSLCNPLTSTSQPISGIISGIFAHSEQALMEDVLNNQVIIGIFEEEMHVNALQSMHILHDFLTNFPAEDYTIQHMGRSNKGDEFAKGTFINKDSIIHWYMLFKVFPNMSKRLCEIRFEK